MAIRNRLAVLMAERNLKATDISVKTGISRSTLSALTTQRSKMIQLRTLNLLCQYFDITPREFFDYDPHPASDDWYLTKSKGR